MQDKMVYFNNMVETFKLFRRNWQIIIPSFLGFFLSVFFALVFVYLNDLFPIILRDPSELFVGGGLSEIAKKISAVLITKSHWVKIIGTFVGFVFANFLAGSSLISTKFFMINEASKGKKTNVVEAFFKGSKFYWRVIEMRVMVFLLILVFSAILGLPLFLLSKYFSSSSFLIALSVVIILLVIRLILLFRYPILFREDLRAIPSLVKSMRLLKENLRYIVGIWLISLGSVFAVSLLFEFFKVFTNDSFYGLAFLPFVLISLYVIKELVMVFVNTWVDIFLFLSYLKIRK